MLCIPSARQRGDAAPARKASLSGGGGAAVPAAPRSIRAGSSRDMYVWCDRDGGRDRDGTVGSSQPEGSGDADQPSTHGSAIHTRHLEDRGPRAVALDPVVRRGSPGGARRDEEKERAGNGFSFRTAQHGWDLKNQRPSCEALQRQEAQGRVDPVPRCRTGPELGHLAVHLPREHIPIACRSTHRRGGAPGIERTATLIATTTSACTLRPGEVPTMPEGVARTLAAIRSPARSSPRPTPLPAIIIQDAACQDPERQGRVTDHDLAASVAKAGRRAISKRHSFTPDARDPTLEQYLQGAREHEPAALHRLQGSCGTDGKS